MNCVLCETRRPRRYCPGVHGDICAPCCGSSREVTVDCPFDCEYLREARVHERLPEADPASFPNADVRVTDRFLEENQQLVTYTGAMIFRAGIESPGTVDLDVREALDDLIRTYRTRDTGLLYDTRPANPIAAAIYARLEQGFHDVREALKERSGINTIRDTDILGVLVFFQRVERSNNNGRRRGRAFLDFLRTQFGIPANVATATPLIS